MLRPLINARALVLCVRAEVQHVAFVGEVPAHAEFGRACYRKGEESRAVQRSEYIGRPHAVARERTAPC